MASVTTPAARVNTIMRPTWQEKLQGPIPDCLAILPLLKRCTNPREDHCRNAQLQAPVFNLVSDRRGS
jgi:hypothetical protein